MSVLLAIAFGGLGLRYGTLGAVLGGASTPAVVVPAAPALTWNSLETDDEPDFLVDLPSGNVDPDQDAAADDHLIIEYQLQAGGAWTEYVDRTLIAGDITDDTISVSGVGSVANGDYFFRARIERGALIGTNSANASVTINLVIVPVNSVAPVISGNLQFGQTLTTTDGTWSNTPTSYAYQWKRDGASIGGATASTRVLAELDAGADMTCEVTASNAGGAGTPAASNTLSIDVYLVDTTAHPVSATDLTTYTFSAAALGTAAANRIILVAVHGANALAASANISTVTVDGNSAARVIQLLTDTNSNRAAAIYAVALAAGTTGDVVVTFGAGQSRAGIGVSAMYGAASATASDTDSATCTAGNPTTNGAVTLTVPAKGVALGVSTSGGGVTVGCTWTGLTERYDQSMETTNFDSAADLNSNAGGNIAMSAIWNFASTNGGAVFASWGP
jgi:hypothetical protein